MLKNKNVLVTGGAGFIGSNIVEELLKYKCKVTVLDNLSNGHLTNIEPFMQNITFIKGDIRDIKTCEKACENIDIICHQAAMGSVPRSMKEPLNTVDNNIIGTLNMLETARRMGVKRFVFASSSSVYGKNPNLPKVESDSLMPLSVYALSKLSNEQYSKLYWEQFGVETIGFRYHNVFGKNQRMGTYPAVIPIFLTQLMKNNDLTIFGDGEQTRDFCHVSNVVNANILAMTTENKEAFGEVFNVGCNKRISINDMSIMLKNIVGKNVKNIYVDERKGDIKHSLASIDKIKKYLNYEVVMYFKDGLYKTVYDFN